MSLIMKIILVLSSILSLPAADKTQYLARLSFNSILELINGTSSVLRKLLKLLINGTAIVVFFRIPLALFGVGKCFS